jgi:hypothetical protein
MENLNVTNLYIIEEILSDYTSGMAIISASSLERCRELFEAKFKSSFCGDGMYEYDEAIKGGFFKVLSVVGQSEGVVSYVYGGA